MTRILGVDPGSQRTGWAVVELHHGVTAHVDNGVILAGTSDEPLPDRLLKIARGLERVIGELKPVAASIETMFHAKNARSALVLGQARGVAMVTCAAAGLSIHEYGPMQVKLAVTGHGRASKEGVQQMVKSILALPEVAQVDASDALAMALTHAYSLARPAALRSATVGSAPSRRGSRKAWEAYLQPGGPARR